MSEGEKKGDLEDRWTPPPLRAGQRLRSADIGLLCNMLHLLPNLSSSSSSSSSSRSALLHQFTFPEFSSTSAKLNQ